VRIGRPQPRDQVARPQLGDALDAPPVPRAPARQPLDELDEVAGQRAPDRGRDQLAPRTRRRAPQQVADEPGAVAICQAMPGGAGRCRPASLTARATDSDSSLPP
jgi:hypothetical protein